MIDTTTPDGKLVDAAMTLAAERGWNKVTLLDIAESAGMTLADVRAHFDNKSDVLRAFSEAIDNEVLKGVAKRQKDQSPRDSIFEVIMARFDALAPYRQALQSIVKDSAPDPAMIRPLLNSQQWMLQAAGVGTEGGGGAVRTLGLASVYASVFRTWLDDDDPGMARTMAALDRRLRRGEQNLRALDAVCGAAKRFTGVFSNLRAGRRRSAGMGDMPPEAATDPVSETSTTTPSEPPGSAKPA